MTLLSSVAHPSQSHGQPATQPGSTSGIRRFRVGELRVYRQNPDGSFQNVGRIPATQLDPPSLHVIGSSDVPYVEVAAPTGNPFWLKRTDLDIAGAAMGICDRVPFATRAYIGETQGIGNDCSR